MFYKNGSFYSEDPSEGKAISESDVEALLRGQEAGRTIAEDENGYPYLVERQPSVKDQTAILLDLKQKHLTADVQTTTAHSNGLRLVDLSDSGIARAKNLIDTWDDQVANDSDFNGTRPWAFKDGYLTAPLTKAQYTEIYDDIVQRKNTYHWIVDSIFKTYVSQLPLPDDSPFLTFEGWQFTP